jgi:hypothetical protein
MATTTFTQNERTFTIDYNNDNGGLWRQNAMTFYSVEHNWLISAREYIVDPSLNLEDMPITFYLILTIESGWVRVSIEEYHNIVTINDTDRVAIIGGDEDGDSDDDSVTSDPTDMDVD